MICLLCFHRLPASPFPMIWNWQNQRQFFSMPPSPLHAGMLENTLQLLKNQDNFKERPQLLNKSEILKFYKLFKFVFEEL